jgi:LPS export ABC transporter protein LptC
MIGRIMLLIALGALAFLVVQFTREDGSAGGSSPSVESTGYYVREAEVTEYGADGRVALRFTADSAVEIPAREEILLNKVDVEYFALPRQRWTLTAATGRVPTGGRQVELEGAVTMRGERDGEARAAIVETDRLTLDTASQRAYTDAPVTLAFGETRLAAIGMDANLLAETLRLEAGVNGRFAR